MVDQKYRDLQIQKIVSRKKDRERLKVIHFIKTNEAEYLVYNTQTLQGIDCVNIEIERVTVTGKKDIILEYEIFEDSFGAMGGDSFHSLVIDALNHLRGYIKERGELIIEDKLIK